MVSEELASKCNEASGLAAEINEVIVGEQIDKVLTAIGVLAGTAAETVEQLQQFFLTMEHAAVASMANKHGYQVREH